MSDPYPWLKLAHIVSATVLFGTGIGTAFHMVMSHRRGVVEAIDVAARNTVLADWLFTSVAGVVQPLSGGLLIWLKGYSPFEQWLVITYGLYVVAIACWLPVVWIQIEIKKMAAEAVRSGTGLPERYHRLMRLWVRLGWPAFLSLLAIFYLMIARPVG